MAKSPTYIITLALAALLIISVVAGIYYYSEFEQERQSNNQYVSELKAATDQYNQLASNYNSALSLYNETLSFLTRAIAVVNTSQPIYQQVNTQLSQLWDRYLDLKPASDLVYSADILVSFGNGTRDWYNATQVQPGWNMYIVTVVLTHGDLQAQWYPQYQEHYVSEIDGLSNTKTMSWFLWTYNETSSWQVAQAGADALPVYNGSVFAWTYCGETASYAPECSP